MTSIRTACAVFLLLVACSKKASEPAAKVAEGSATAKVEAPKPEPAKTEPTSSLGAPPAGMDAAHAAACDRGDAAGCVGAAKSYAPQGGYRLTMSKQDADKKEQVTALYAQRACELGNGEGCALVAQFNSIIGDDKLLSRACELGYVASCGSIGTDAFDRATKRADRQAAADQIEKACVADAIDWRALTNFHGAFCGKLYEIYSSELKDKAKAAKFLALQCSQGYKEHCACKTNAECVMPAELAGDMSCEAGKCEVSSLH